jgi:hypothetical protein
MIDSIVAGLHKVASELLAAATHLNDTVKEHGVIDVSDAQERLTTICTQLDDVYALLTDRASPLAELVRNVDKTQVSAAIEKAEAFLEEHRAVLEKLGLKGRLLEQATHDIEEQITNRKSDTYLEAPQGLTEGPVLEILKQFRSLVCKLSKLAEFMDQVIDAGLIKEVVSGVMGVATIVVDVTGAVTVGPHVPTLWVFVKAIKSTWSGFHRVRRAVHRLTEAISTYESLLSERTQDDLKKLAKNRPKVKLCDQDSSKKKD